MIEWSAYASRQLAQVGLAQRIAFAGGMVNDVIFGFQSISMNLLLIIVFVDLQVSYIN